MKDLNIKVEPLNGNTLTILEGKTLDQKPPEIIAITGDIKSISNFLNVRLKDGSGLQTIDITKAVLLVDKKGLTIELLLDPENYYGAKIKGALQKSDELAPFRINENKKFTKTELVTLLKFNKLLFFDKDQHSKTLTAFQKLDAHVNFSSKDSADDRGNKERSFIKNVETNAPTEFILFAPVFKGFPAMRFRVEICLDVTEGSAMFWFESVELHEIMQAQVNEIFEEELKSAEGFVIINQ